MLSYESVEFDEILRPNRFFFVMLTLINTIELIQMLNRCGHGIAYSQREETVPSENGINK